MALMHTPNNQSGWEGLGQPFDRHTLVCEYALPEHLGQADWASLGRFYEWVGQHAEEASRSIVDVVENSFSSTDTPISQQALSTLKNDVDIVVREFFTNAFCYGAAALKGEEKVFLRENSAAFQGGELADEVKQGFSKLGLADKEKKSGVQAAEERLQGVAEKIAGYESLRITVKVDPEKEEVRLFFKDNRPFENLLERLQKVPDPEDIFKSYGRGLIMVNSLADSVEWVDPENKEEFCVCLRPPESEPQEASG